MTAEPYKSESLFGGLGIIVVLLISFACGVGYLLHSEGVFKKKDLVALHEEHVKQSQERLRSLKAEVERVRSVAAALTGDDEVTKQQIRSLKDKERQILESLRIEAILLGGAEVPNEIREFLARK